MKRRFSIWIVLAAVAALLFSVSVLAEEQEGVKPQESVTSVSGDWEYTMEDSGLVITAYKGTAQTVVIPSTIDDLKVSIIGRQAFYNNHTMRSLTIPEGVTSIRAEAFRGCTALNTINYNAKNCTFPDVWIHDNNRGVGVFSGAGAASVSLKVVFGSGVKKVPDKMFFTASIGESGYNGADYAHVTSVQFNSAITEIGVDAFRNCDDLETLTLGSGTTSIAQNAFNDCDGLTEITLNNNLTRIESSAFASCDNLETIGWGTGLDSIGDAAFSGCTSLKKALIPEPVTTIGVQAFYNCTSLTEIKLPKTLTKIWGEAFRGTTKLNKITVDCANVDLDVADVWIYDSKRGVGVFSGAGASAGGLQVIFTSNVTKVPARLFYTASIGEYGIQGSDYAHITSISFASTVTEIGENAFRNCDTLGAVTLGSGITKIGANAFNDCDAITSLTMNNKLQFIEGNAFKACDTLASIDWGSGLDTIGNASFEGCIALKEAVIPTPTKTIGVRAFADCTSLTKAVIPSSINNLNGEAFCGTSKLADLQINAVNLKVPDVWIYDSNRGTGVFCGAGSGVNTLKVTFGKQVTSIPANIFMTASTSEYGMKGSDFAHITDVIFLGKVNTIDVNAFRSCQSLARVCFDGTKTEWNACTIQSGNEDLTNAAFSCNGWKRVGSDWYYVDYLGNYKKNWQKIDNSWYYLGTDGKMVTGWKKISDNWYYFESAGAMVTGWKQLSGKWYYFASGGIMQTGWQKISNKWYYFDAASGGAMATGWKKLSNKWYYFDAASGGAMATGWKKISDKWYYFESGGIMVTGWKQLSGKWYYFESAGGAMVTGWKTISGTTYYFKASGVMAAAEWCKGYYLNKDGSWTYKYKATWRQNSKGWWYGDESGWYAKNATITIDDKKYTFDSNGFWVK